MKFIQLVKDLVEAYRIDADRKRKQREKYRVEYAFTSGGVKYYRFADVTNLPFQRGRAALNAYNEVEMRCSRETLLRFTEAVDKVLHQQTIDVFRIKNLNDVLKDRLMLTADLDLCYRLAACVFFDGTEKPEIYEEGYAAKKIERWKKDQTATDFFLQKPVMELMPFLQNVAGNADAYIRLQTELNLLHEQMIQSAGLTSSSARMKTGSAQ